MRKARRAKVGLDLVFIGVAEWEATGVGRGIFREHGRHSLKPDARQSVARKIVPYGKDKGAAWAKHALGLAHRLLLVGKEHHAELREDEVEGMRGERQIGRIGQAPGDGRAGLLGPGVIDHRLTDVGRFDLGFGKSLGERQSHPACPAGEFENSSGRPSGGARQNFIGEGRPHDGLQVFVVKFRHGAVENNHENRLSAPPHCAVESPLYGSMRGSAKARGFDSRC
jgi:hypothetical protein